MTEVAEGHHIKDQGDLKNAAPLLREALEARRETLGPRHQHTLTSLNNMALLLKDQGKLDEAIEAFNKALSIKPDYGTAKHMLSALTGNKNETAPREYVENLFDGYSKKFEASLVDNLEYKTPKLIRDILIKANINGSLGSIIDLGCGTGLFGSEIRDHCSQLEGIDLSKRMLDEARKKNAYDRLMYRDIVDYLSTEKLNFDYFISSDVFVYIGDLSDVFRLIKLRNSSGGKFVFSTEHTNKGDFSLEKSGRYSHSKMYIESLCEKYRYTLSHFKIVNIRKDKGVYITGGLYLLDF